MRRYGLRDDQWSDQGFSPRPRRPRGRHGGRQPIVCRSGFVSISGRHPVAGSSTILISKWERGEVRPSGPSLKLLALADKKGIDAIL
jgi:hypothetical protein